MVIYLKGLLHSGQKSFRYTTDYCLCLPVYKKKLELSIQWKHYILTTWTSIFYFFKFNNLYNKAEKEQNLKKFNCKISAKSGEMSFAIPLVLYHYMTDIIHTNQYWSTNCRNSNENPVRPSNKKFWPLKICSYCSKIGWKCSQIP